MWTQFMDMHSGGGLKLAPYEYIYIEAPEEEAKVIFFNRFGRNPERVTCTCCGGDYSISESADFAEASAYERGCRFDKATDKYVEEADTTYRVHPVSSVEEYVKLPTVLVITADQIKADERSGAVPEQGYVWVG